MFGRGEEGHVGAASVVGAVVVRTVKERQGARVFVLQSLPDVFFFCYHVLEAVFRCFLLDSFDDQMFVPLLPFALPSFTISWDFKKRPSVQQEHTCSARCNAHVPALIACQNRTRLLFLFLCLFADALPVSFRHEQVR